jgi:hypothetical protein
MNIGDRKQLTPKHLTFTVYNTSEPNSPSLTCVRISIFGRTATTVPIIFRARSVGFDGQLFLAIDRSGSPTNSNIYMLASMVPPGRSTTDMMKLWA